MEQLLGLSPSTKGTCRAAAAGTEQVLQGNKHKDTLLPMKVLYWNHPTIYIQVIISNMRKSENDGTGILGKKSECSYQESNLGPSDY